MIMTRLMCSSDRKELEALKSRLFRVGIRSEICSNPVAGALGIVRLELNVSDPDLMEASRIHQEFLTRRDSDYAANGHEISSPNNNQVSCEEAELVVEPVRPMLARPQITAPSRLEPPRPALQDSSGGDLAEAAGLLEKEVEEVLARDQQLTQQCAVLQDQMKALDESLAQVKAELTRESSARSAAEQKVAEARAARGSLEKDLDNLSLRLKTSETSLAAAQGRLESQTRELRFQQAKVDDLTKEVASRNSQLSTLAESLAEARAALENEKGLRQVAEQNLSEHAAARESLEQQLAHFAELQAHLQKQNEREREQIQASLDTVNKLRSRLSQKRSGPPER